MANPVTTPLTARPVAVHSHQAFLSRGAFVQSFAARAGELTSAGVATSARLCSTANSGVGVARAAVADATASARGTRPAAAGSAPAAPPPSAPTPRQSTPSRQHKETRWARILSLYSTSPIFM